MDEQNLPMLDILEKILQEFEKTILPEDGKGALKFLTMDESELACLSSEQCGEAAVMLTSLSYNVHRAVNKEKAKAGYLNKSLMKNIAPRMGQYSNQYKTTEEKMTLAIADDDFAVKLQKALVICQAKIDRMEYISIKLDNSAEAFKALQLTKRKMS